MRIRSRTRGELAIENTRDSGQNPDGISGYVQVFRSTDGGETFPQQSQACAPGQSDITFNIQLGPGRIPGARFLTMGSAQPWILPDPLVPGRIHVVACDDPDNDVNAGDPSDIFIMTSSDYGQTWTAPRRVPSSTTPTRPGSIRLFPSELGNGPACVLIVFHLDRDRAAWQIDFAAVTCGGLIAPGIHQQVLIHPYANAIICGGDETILTSVQVEQPRPAHREPIRVDDARRRCSVAPVKVDP